LVIVSWQGIPYLVLLVAFCAIAAETVMRRTRYGAQLYAIGGNPQAARLSGIDVKRVIFWNFVIAGFGYGLPGSRSPPGSAARLPAALASFSGSPPSSAEPPSQAARAGVGSAGGSTSHGQPQQRHEPHERAAVLSRHGAGDRAPACRRPRSHWPSPESNALA